MSIRLYVGNLSVGVNSLRLEQLFLPHGEVSAAQIMLNQIDGTSQGFGVVEMKSDAEADLAIEALHGALMDDRAITVNRAAAAVPDEQGSPPPPRYGSGRCSRFFDCAGSVGRLGRMTGRRMPPLQS